MKTRQSTAHEAASNGRSRADRGPVPGCLGVDAGARRRSIEALTQILADLSALRSLYKHFHWRISGRRFMMFHELFDKHAHQTNELVDAVAERIPMLGGQATAWPADVARATRIPPPGRTDDPEGQLRELLEAHRLVLEFAHDAAETVEKAGDPGTADLLVSQVIRTGQLQTWFIGEHLDGPQRG